MKALFLGSAPAAALGVLLGNFAHPELAVAPPPMQPVEASYAPSALEPAPYYAPPPHPYVSRAEWRSALADPPPLPEPEPLPAVDAYAVAHYEPSEPPVADSEQPKPSYPSVAGDILAGTERERPPPVEATQPEA